MASIRITQFINTKSLFVTFRKSAILHLKTVQSLVTPLSALVIIHPC